MNNYKQQLCKYYGHVHKLITMGGKGCWCFNFHFRFTVDKSIKRELNPILLP